MVSMGNQHELWSNLPRFVLIHILCFQRCLHWYLIAGTRIYVHEDIYDNFLALYTERMKKINVGAPFDKGVDQGPQNSKMQYDKILGYIQSGLDEGATVHLGGKSIDRGSGGYYIQPTIFTDVKPEMKV